MSRLRALLPVASVVVLTILAVLPWGVPVEDRVALPLLSVAVIYYWTCDRTAWLPEGAVFLCGLLLDVLTQGPLGYWALVYLVAQVVAVVASRFRFETVAARFAVFAAAVVVVAVFSWLAASVYFLQLLASEPYARGTAIVVLAGLAVTCLHGVFIGSGAPIRAVRLTRGE